MRRSTPKPEYLRRLEHRRRRLDDRRFKMPEGRADRRLKAKISRLELRIYKLQGSKIPVG